MLRKGKLIAVEGAEGAGKTTATQALAAKLRAVGFDVHVTRQPGGTALGKELRSILVDRALVLEDPDTATLLMLADRVHHLKSEIVPLLEQGTYVLTDRHTPSTLVIQGLLAGGEQRFYALRNLVASMALALQQPLLNAAHENVFLNVSSHVALQRCQGRGAAHNNAIDPTTLEQSHAGCQAYRRYFTELAHDRSRSVHWVDADRNVEAQLDTLVTQLLMQHSQG